MVNKSLSGSLDVQLKFYSEVKIFLKKKKKKSDSNFCVLCICRHLTGDMSQGRSQETNLKINLGRGRGRGEKESKREKGVERKKGEKHHSTYFIPLGQRESKK